MFPLVPEFGMIWCFYFRLLQNPGRFDSFVSICIGYRGDLTVSFPFISDIGAIGQFCFHLPQIPGRLGSFVSICLGYRGDLAVSFPFASDTGGDLAVLFPFASESGTILNGFVFVCLTENIDVFILKNLVELLSHICTFAH
jgi:hypothetical protein